MALHGFDGVKSNVHYDNFSCLDTTDPSAFQYKIIREMFDNHGLKKSLNGFSKGTPRRTGGPRAKGGVYKTRKALSIGMNYTELDDKGKALDDAANDARRFTSCLIEKLNFTPSRVRTITDEEPGAASLERILEGLDWLFKGTENGDLRVLFISGHCAPHDVNQIVSLVIPERNPRRRLVPSTIFRRYLNQLPSGCTVEVVLDCCHSAGLVKLPHVVERMAPMVNTMMLSPDANEERHREDPAAAKGRASTPNAQGGAATPGSARISFRSEAGHSSQAKVVPTGPPPFVSAPDLHDGVLTSADVTVIAAAGTDGKAFEYHKGDSSGPGGVMASAICQTIEDHSGPVTFQALWDNLSKKIRAFNEPRLRKDPNEHEQLAEVLSSKNSSETMGWFAFHST